MKNAAGFSIVELLVVVGIMGIVAIGVTTLFSSMNSQMFGINLKFEQFQLSTSIEAAMRNQISCKGIMNLPQNNVEIPDTSPTAVVSLSRIAHINQSSAVINEVVPSLNTDIPGTRLQVTGIKMTAPGNPASGPLLAGSATGTSRTYLADLVIATKHNAAAYPQFRPISIQGLIVTVNGSTNKVDSCTWNTVNQTEVNCPGDQAVTGISSSGSPICGAMPSKVPVGTQCGLRLVGCRGAVAVYPSQPNVSCDGHSISVTCEALRCRSDGFWYESGAPISCAGCPLGYRCQLLSFPRACGEYQKENYTSAVCFKE